MKTYKELLEIKQTKITAQSIMKAFQSNTDWGDSKDRAYIKKGNLIYIDSFYYSEQKSLNNLVNSWKKGGHNYDYWLEQGVNDIKIVNTFSELKATGRHKKYSDTGIVGVELKIL